MKKNKFLIISGLAMAGAFASPSFAIEAPDGSADPPAPQGAPVPEQMPEAGAKMGYLGVYSQVVPKMLRSHLPQLGEERGVLLMGVMGESPAGEAGLQNHDILLQIDDQELTGPLDVKRVVGGKKAGEKIQLKLLRAGKELELEATLGERPEMPRIAGLDPLGGDDLARRLQEQLNQMNQGVDPFEKLKELIPEADLERARQNLQMQIVPMGEGAAQMQHFELRLDGGGMQRKTSRIQNDEQGKVRIESDGESTSLFLYDQEGKLLFEGPFNEQDDLEAVPDDQLERLNRLGLKPGESGMQGIFELRQAP